MATVEYRGNQVELNEQGFMMHSSQWTPAIGEAIAEQEGIKLLTDRHWTVLTFCREDTAREGHSPGLRRISKLSGVGTKELYKLFPKGPGKLAAKIAGLPKPKSCI